MCRHVCVHILMIKLTALDLAAVVAVAHMTVVMNCNLCKHTHSFFYSLFSASVINIISLCQNTEIEEEIRRRFCIDSTYSTHCTGAHPLMALSASEGKTEFI